MDLDSSHVLCLGGGPPAFRRDTDSNSITQVLRVTSEKL
jgi:hypothetical protein